jgi:hypothetical protein
MISDLKKYSIKRSDEDIDHLIDWTWNSDGQGRNLTLILEESVKDALSWLFGERDDSPSR